MMLVSDLKPLPDVQVHFELSDHFSVPEEAGCYVLATFQKIILYIGQSNNISRRMHEHLNDETKKRVTPAGRVFWFHYKLCGVYDLSNLERGWVNEHLIREGELPFFNSVSPPI